MQVEMVRIRKERNTTIKQLNEIVSQMDYNTLQQAESHDPTRKVLFVKLM